MYKVAMMLLLLAVPQMIPASTVPSTSSEGGLSGTLFLPESQVLATGLLRIQGRLDYLRLEDGGGTLLLLPIGVTWGMTDDLELGGEIPVYLDDGNDDTSPIGDITTGCGWLYETANGGSNLVLKGELTLPTGEEGRDPGTELALGCATGTTFRLFRLQFSAFYVLNGGRNPFEDDLTDLMRFSAGGASYLTRDLQLAASMNGTTAGTLDAAATLSYAALRNTVFFWTLRGGLDGAVSYSVSVGAAWTGEGF